MYLGALDDSSAMRTQEDDKSRPKCNLVWFCTMEEYGPQSLHMLRTK